MKWNPITTLVFCFFVFLGTPFISAQTIQVQEVDVLVQKAMKTFDVPGIAVAIIKDDQVVLSKGYGFSSLQSKQKVDENTLFVIASNSKAFTTAALGILIDRGKLTWDDKVTDVIPEFKMYDPYVTQEFTIRDLLTHRSGLGLGAGDLMFWPGKNDFTLKEVIHNLRYLKPVSGFRSKYDYDNLLYVVAGEVVARVSGKSWEEFIETEIMVPLEMTSSVASFSRLKGNNNVIDPHAPVNGKIEVIARDFTEVTNPAGGIYSSVHDMSNWVIMHLNNGKFGKDFSQKLISEKVHEELWTPQTITPVRNTSMYNSHFASYGLGWGLTDVKGYKQVSHTGGLAGIVTQVTMIPELKLGIIVFTNQQSDGAFLSITNSIKDYYLGIKEVDRIKQYSESSSTSLRNARKILTETDSVLKAQSVNPLTEKDLMKFSHTYRDNWFGDVIISLINGKLRFDSKRSPKLTGQLMYYKGNTFVVKWDDRSLDADAFVMFGLDFNGNANRIKMKAISPLTDFSFDFQDLDFSVVGK